MVIIQAFRTDLHQKYKIWTDLRNFWKGGANLLIWGGLNIWALIFQLCHCPSYFLSIKLFFLSWKADYLRSFEESWSDYSGVLRKIAWHSHHLSKSPRSFPPQGFQLSTPSCLKKTVKKHKSVCVWRGGGGLGVGGGGVSVLSSFSNRFY